MEVDSTTSNGGSHDIFDEAGNLESKFYAEGYESGHAHGRLHGLFEGRALGQEKAWEIWEEVGFYEGFAEYWLGVLGGEGQTERGGTKGKEARAAAQANQLLDLISTFPTLNPTPSPTDAPTSNINNPEIITITDTKDHTDPTDLPRLLSAIRAKYRLLCTSVGARPRLVAASSAPTPQESNGYSNGVEGLENGNGPVSGIDGVVQGVEGPMKGVDTRQLRF